jgi:hypothetical protein
MSIKKLFDKKQKQNILNKFKISNKTVDDLIENSDLESANQLDSHTHEVVRYVPDVDYSEPSNFARFGFASEYYKNSIEFIYGTYPYDGSLYEKEAWHNSASFLDNWIFEHKYPRRTGHAIFSPDNVTTTTITGGYEEPTTKEYIYVKGGPHKDSSASTFAASWPEQYDIRRDGGSANLYNTASNRNSNLDFNLENGATVEFWLKRAAMSNEPGRQVIFDLWNNTNHVGAGHGRFRVELTSSGTPFLITALSGTDGALRAEIGSSLTFNDIGDDTWHHYCFTALNGRTDIQFELYRDGKRIETVVTGAIFNPVTGAMQAAIGSLVTTPSDYASSMSSMLGWGKLSASLDEFRYWKTKRDPKQIGQNWFSQVGAGTNTDPANTTLGVYYKFNEGVTTNNSIDSVALDYSGRISNGSWTGYTVSSRNTGSAINDAGYREFEDPIVRSSHPDITALSSDLQLTGKAWDTNNNSNFNRLIPSWLLDDDQAPGYDNLMGLIQVTSYYLDNLSVLIEQIPEIKSRKYASGSLNRLLSKPNVFAERLLKSSGFQFDDLFVEASALEEIFDKNEDIQLQEKVQRIKNLIYTNIYNNLDNLYKTKGTFKSIRHLLHCIGINEDVIKTNLYANNLTYKIRDNFRISEEKSKLIDFNHAKRFQGTIYQYPISSDSETVSFISGASDKQLEGLGYTYEGEFVFPKKPEIGNTTFETYDYPYLTSSLFGVHTAQAAFPTDTTWASSDTSNFQVYAVRPAAYSNNITFILTSSDGSAVPFLTSSGYKDVYENSKWNLAVKMSPTKDPWATMVPDTSSSSDTYTIEFYGVNYVGDQINNEFSVTGTMTRAQATGSLGVPRRVYVGAHRQDFTSSLLQYTDVRVNNFKTWAKALSSEEVRYHAKFNNNIGTIDAYRNTALFDSALQGVSVPSIATLLFNWDFSNLTGSDNSGQMTVFDTTSGSIESSDRYSWLSDIVDKNYSGRADILPLNSTDVIDIDYLTNYKQTLPDSIASNDMVQVLTDDDIYFDKDSRPINYFFSIEKNMYQAISEEMLQYFATAKDFNNIIGEPVNRYRMRYKQVEKLRQLFFERIQNTADLEKFINYYKWFDDAVSTMIQNFIPASARNSEDISTVVESHLLERNKYWNKFPTLEFKDPQPSATIKGAEELGYNWKIGHAPVPVPYSSHSLLFASSSNQSLRVSDSDHLSFGNGTSDSPFSVSFWMKWNSAVTADQYFFCKGDGSSADEYQVFFDHSENEIKVILFDGTPARFEFATFDFNPVSSSIDGSSYLSAWTHIAATYNGAGGSSARNGIKMYVNGTDHSASSTNGSSYTAMENSATNFRVAASPLGGLTYDGYLDEFVVFSGSALTQAQVTGIYNAGCPTDVLNNSWSSNIVAYWRMGENDESVIQDSSGFGLNAVPLNNPIIERDSPEVCRVLVPPDENCLWWKERAERGGTWITSGNPSVDANRNDLLNVITTEITGSTYAKRALSQTYKFTIDDLTSQGSSNNKYENKKQFFYKPIIKFGSSGSMDILASSFETDKPCDSKGSLVTRKHKWIYKAQTNLASSGSYTSGKGDMFTPFTLYSSSVSTGYNSQLSSFNNAGTAINNMHQDTYENMPAPMQGPFTERWVGGSQHRHTNINYAGAYKNLDTPVNRAEAFHVSVTNSEIKIQDVEHQFPQAPYFRDEVAKRPINIKNVKMTSSSPTVIGNYEKRREYFQSSGHDINNLWWISGSTGDGGFSQSTSESLVFSSSVEFTVPNRGILENGQRNETIFLERFSAPGGPETMGIGFLDTYSAQYSVYNALPFRNLTVRKQLNKLLTNHQTTNQWDPLSPGGMAEVVGYDAVLSPTPFSVTTATASYHQVKQNLAYKLTMINDSSSNAGFIQLKKIYNNGSVTWQQGYSDVIYAWFKKSLVSDYPGASAPLDYVVTLDGTHLSGSDYNAPVFTFQSQSQYGVFVDTNGNRVFGLDANLSSSAERTFTDFVGLNTNVYSPIITERNAADGTTTTYFGYVDSANGYRPSPINWGHTVVPGLYAGGMVDRWTTSSFGSGNMADANLLNSIILNRQGPYGWPTWKQIRGSEHPIIREFNKRNELSINFGPAQGLNKRDNQIINYRIPPVSKTKPSSVELEMISSKRVNNEQLIVPKNYAFSMQNQNITFDNPSLRNKLGINQILLDNEGKRSQPYDTLRKSYMYEIDPKFASPIDDFVSLSYADTIYPKRSAAFLSGTHYRENFAIEYWRDERSQREINDLANSFGIIIPSQSMWVLDGRKQDYRGYDMVTSNANTQPTGALGELQNQYSIYHMNNPTTVSGATLYSRPIEEEISAAAGGSTPRHEVRVVAGDAVWEAGAQSGKNLSGPFYESYDEYAKELKFVGKEYSLIPEFRISEHMNFYIDDKYGNFLSDNPGFLTITGSSIHDSATSSFGKIYSTTDFLQMFSVVRQDHEGFARASELTLECSALKKFLPYNGFYPAQRTEQLSQMFSQSYGTTIVYSGSQPSYRTMATPLFAPGILHNSIKSALAVDYPIYTGSHAVMTTNSNTAVPWNNDDYQKRLPFETLVDPEFYLAGVNIADGEPHPSASINCTASLPGAGSSTYRLAMHNFLAEVPGFFLKDSGLTTFASKDDRNSYVVETFDGTNPKEYKMRVVVSNAKFRTRKQIADLFKATGDLSAFTSRTTASWEFNPPTIDIYRRFTSNPHQKISTGQYYGSQIPFQNMRYGSSFGPPTRAAKTFFCGTRDGSNFSSYGSIEYTPFTPPYYDGYSEIEFTFRPTHEGEYDLNELLGQTTHEVRRYPTGQRILSSEFDITPDTYDICTRNMMQLTSSLNFLQKANVKDVQTDPAGNPREIKDPNAAVLQWVIQPKWETPVLDFSGSSVTLPSSATGSVPLGLWHQYGQVPANSEAGLFMSIQDPQVEELGLSERTGSLADLVGFKKGETRLGQIAPEKEIYEAIIAIPFTRRENGKMQFYSIDRKTVDLLLGKINADQVPVGQLKNPGASITEMVRKMQRYVIPPKFDFVTNQSLQPFAMYLFEFKHKLKEKDLSDIWQNLPPDSLMDMQEPKSMTSVASISHPLLIDEFYGLTPSPANKKTTIDSKTQWLVFKVKQKAKTNYYEMTADSKDDVRFKFNFQVGSGDSNKETSPDYSYNWPYDFFSMVELAKISATVKFTKGVDPRFEDSLIEERPRKSKKQDSPSNPAQQLRQQIPQPVEAGVANRSQPEIVDPQKKAQVKSIKKDNFDGKSLGVSPPIPRIK